MTAFVVTAILMLIAVVPCGIVVVRGPAMDSVVAFEAIGANIVMALALIAGGFNRSGEYELPLLSAVLIYGSGLVYVRFMERGI